MRIFENRDCMEGMKEYPDKYFDLAIVDPPYGIGAGSNKFKNGTSKTKKTYFREKDWDTKTPDSIYFQELFRISKNQIIWGWNYYVPFLSACRCFIVWDKTIHGNSYADCETAWTSFNEVARIFRKNIVDVTMDGRIHPTQKPKSLYKWLLHNYAKDGDKILDTHVGSASSLIAFEDAGFDYVAFEIDKEYFDNAVKRIEQYRSQYPMDFKNKVK